MTQLRHLTEEIAAGLQFYVAGRSGTLLKTAFVLCDDYTELTTKMALVSRMPTWSELRDPNNPRSFKNYHEVLGELLSHVRGNEPNLLHEVDVLQSRMKERRKRRNVFFHSTTLLDLSVTRRDTAEAFVDLLDYGALLFGSERNRAVASTTSDMECLEAFVRADVRASIDLTVLARLNDALQREPRNRRVSARQGVQLAVFPEDLHLLSALRWGGDRLRDILRTL